MVSQIEFHGPNVAYIIELYERYRANPDSVDAATREFFQHWSPPQLNGAIAHPAEADIDTRRLVGLINLVQSIRQYGHLAAHLDPLGGKGPGDPSLSLEAQGLTEADLHALPASVIDSPAAEGARDALEVVDRLRAIYCGSSGFDLDHIHNPVERAWLRDAIEARHYRINDAQGPALAVLERLTEVEVFESFLQQTFPTKYRFSIEGLDMMVPMLDEIIAMAANTGTRTIAIAMAHRGRLNVLAHVMEKPYRKILADFKDPIQLQERQEAIGWTIGDVKYHKGLRRAVNGPDDSGLVLTMPPNPSHLEAVNPVAVGMARAAGTDAAQPGAPSFNPDTTMQILIHGDAAFPGQGIVAETLNLSRLPGYWTGGTIHVIANNQLGFTTLPRDGRSTLYASDLAKGFKVPIIHVNADDPAACIEVARIAFAYQDRFERDVLIDLVGYRRYGHNELDEPGFTQPVMYNKVRQHPTVRQLWADRLMERGYIGQDRLQTLQEKYLARIQAEAEAEATAEELVDEKPEPPPAGMARRVPTAIPAERLNEINSGLRQTVEGFNFYSTRFGKTILSRRDTLNDPDEASVDWATAEELAFASILADGVPIRLTGQDSERGTFSHRHAVLYDADTGEPLVPLQAFPQARASFEIHNSPLSEAAALGFEFGYNVQAPDRLVLWEAQYGDFINGAQTIVDEFIVSAREKWGQTPSLVMLLPHGHEGAGPDHSSGRLERFLAAAAKKNSRIANCTTAAQYFHLLRRQAALLKSDPLPLIVMSPKSLLRNKAVFSRPVDLTEGRWMPVIDDASADPEKIERLVFCSGKFYYDLIDSEYRDHYPNVAIVRIEQLYPFPSPDLQAIAARYKNVKQVVWAQEEPKNMGAWEFMQPRLKRLMGPDIPVDYVGRRRSASPAEGSKTAHQVNQSMIVEYAFNWKF